MPANSIYIFAQCLFTRGNIRGSRIALLAEPLILARVRSLFGFWQFIVMPVIVEDSRRVLEANHEWECMMQVV